jgi:hypothetical protein
MKVSEQQFRQQPVTRSNLTMSDASIVFDHHDNEVKNYADLNFNRRNQLTKVNQVAKNKRTDINIQHISPIKSTYSE